MNYKISLLLLLLSVSVSCSYQDEANTPLCTPVVCGNIESNQANLALYNDSGIDFETFYYDIGGYNDSIDFFPLQQYTCWLNLDTLSTEYFFAKGISNDQIYQSDTLWVQSNTRTFNSGAHVLEIYSSGDDAKLDFQFLENYTGECKDL